MLRSRLLLALLCLSLAVGATLWPAWEGMTARQYAKDYASYHYAVQALAADEDPYDPAALVSLAEADGFAHEVYPYLYPPPFLLGMAWAEGLPAQLTGRVLLVVNHLALIPLGLLFMRWFRVPLPLMVGLLLTFTPTVQSGRLGQVNGVVALLVALALWKRSGAVLSAAAMIKMSPALYLPIWAVQKRIRPVGVAVAGAIGLSVLALLLVPMPVQLRFFTEVLPGFSSGSYNGLQVPIALNANHSIPNLLDGLWPGPDAHTLSAPARTLSSLLLLGLLGGVCLLARRVKTPLGEACLMGAATVVLVVSPVFAYEHHLVLLLLPIAALGSALWAGRLPRWTWGLAAAGYLGIAWPLPWFRAALRAAPELAWLIRESKLMGAVVVGVLCAVVAWRDHRVEK